MNSYTAKASAIGFIAWNLNAAIDRDEVSLDITLDDVTKAVGEGRLLSLVNDCDPSRPVDIIDRGVRAAIDARAKELWEVRGLKNAGAEQKPIHVCLGFLLAILNEKTTDA